MNLLLTEILLQYHDYKPNPTRRTPNGRSWSDLYSFKDNYIGIDWLTDGTLQRLYFYKSCAFHRPSAEGPAVQLWHYNGKIREASYVENDLRHRPSADGPANQEWYDNGQLQQIVYFENGRLHRPASDGPAFQSWHKDGKQDKVSFWENGIFIK